LLIVVLLLFGATRLPKAAGSLGQSIRIFKREVRENADDKSTAANPPEATAAFPPAALPSAAPDPTQQQLLDLQRQVADLQRTATAGNGQAGQTESGQTHQPQ
jgi:sec-independent protein translocase protein TatA